jgi:hypothetical protein
MLGLGKGRNCKREKKERKKKAAHKRLLGKRMSVAGGASSF